jgi:hypothetical protein
LGDGVGNNGGRERESFFSVLIDLNVGEPKRHVGMQRKRYLYLLGA